MLSVFTLFTNFLFVSVALAASLRNGDPQLLASPEESFEDIALARTYNSRLAGPYLTGDTGTFESVVGTIVVPSTSGPDGQASIWVGIDSISGSCQTGISTGIVITRTNGQVTYNAFYEWFPTNWFWQDFAINAGDVLTFGIHATGPTTAVAWIQNQNTGQTVSPSFAGSPRLCLADAEWMISFNDGFLDFESVTYTEAYSYGPKTDYTPSVNSTFFDVQANNIVYTYTTLNGNEVTIKYIG